MLLTVGSLCFPKIEAASVVTPGWCSRAEAGKEQGVGTWWWFSSSVPCQAHQVTLSLSCGPFSPQLTHSDSSSWSQAILINATSFLFLSSFQTHAQAPASSHQPLPWCQQRSSKPEKGPSGLAPMVPDQALPGLNGTGASPLTSEVCSWTLCKSGIKASLHWWQLPCPLPLFLGQVKGPWRTCGCADLAFHHLSELFQALYPERGPLPCNRVVSVLPLVFPFILQIYFLSSHPQRQCNE